jgi:eukaryotic-like serine/threonine-protein kinase
MELCAGLAEAHRRQVIHGDLKSNNVLLARGPDGVRAVITDFGLARHWLPQAALQSGEAGGAPCYMAPELFRGARPSAASDIYALGVILHELATGRKPFDGETRGEERLSRQPAPLQHRWRRIVGRCLEPDPARRYASVAEVSSALVRPRSIRRWGMAAAALVIAGLAGTRFPVPQQETIRLAVLPFETDADSRNLSDGLLLDTADRLKRVKPSGRTMPLWLDSHSRAKLTIIPIGDAVQNHVDGPQKTARMLGATHVLTGELRRDNHRISIQARLSDARSNLPLKEWRAEYALNELRNAPVALAGMVTGTLRLPPLTTAATVNPAAYPDFAAGVGLSRRNDVDAAIPLLKQAVAADPDSPLTHARLAEAQALQFRRTKDAVWLERAKSSLQDAEWRNPDLAMVRLVSAMINQYEGFYDKAESDLQRGLEIEPLNGDLWRRLGKVYQENNQFEGARVALEKAVDVQRDYFKNFQDLGWLYVEQAKYKEAIQECQKMVQLAPDLSDAHLALAVPYCDLGQYRECESELRSALKFDPASSKALQSLASALFYQNRFPEAISWFQRAIAAGPATVDIYLDLGISLDLIGHRSEAQEQYQNGMALAVRGKNPRDGLVKSELSLLYARLGRRALAASEAKDALQLAPASIEVAMLLVRTYEVLDDRDRALELIQNVPDDALRLLNKSPDLAELRRDSRFQKLMRSHRIP